MFSWRRSRLRARQAVLGFTLLEMLVVMVLLGLVTSLALPAMQRWHDAVQMRARLAVVVDALRSASFAAGASRRELVLDETSFEPMTVSSPPRQADSTGMLAAAVPVSAAASAVSAAPAPQVMVPLTSDGRVHVGLPEGWRAQRVEPVRFLANGLCKAGSVTLSTDRQELVTLQVRGPVCAVESSTVSRGTS